MMYKMLADKDKEIEKLKQEREELQDRRTSGEIILSTDLLIKMFNESRQEEGREVKYFYLKAEDGIVTGYETDITRNENNNLLHFNKGQLKEIPFIPQFEQYLLVEDGLYLELWKILTNTRLSIRSH